MTQVGKPKSIKTKFFRSMVILGFINWVVFLSIVIYMFDRNNRLHFNQSVENSSGFYQTLVKTDTLKLSAALEAFTRNEAFKKTFMDGDREALEKMGATLFNVNREKYRITHFSYISLDGTCFLRMQNPEKFGDHINRATFKTAQKTQKPASGIELGRKEYVLRVIKPYLNQGELIGYVEFGQEIDHFNNILKKGTQSEVIVLGNKDAFDEGAYRSAKQTSGEIDNWDDLNQYVVLSSTLNSNSDIAEYVFNAEDGANQKATYLERIRMNDATFMKGVFPFYTVSGAQTGVVYVLNDVTAHLKTIQLMMAVIVVVGAALFLFAFFLTSRFLQKGIIAPLVQLSEKADEVSLGKHLDEKIVSDRNDEIGRLIHSFERLRKSLHMSMKRLKHSRD